MKSYVSVYDVEVVKKNEVLRFHFPAFKCSDFVTNVLVKHSKTCLCARTRNQRAAPRSGAGSESMLTKTSEEHHYS